MRLVREGLYAWTLCCKEFERMQQEKETGDEIAQQNAILKIKAPSGAGYLPLSEDHLNKAMMLVSKVMSHALIRMWLRGVSTHLECN